MHRHGPKVRGCRSSAQPNGVRVMGSVQAAARGPKAQFGQSADKLHCQCNILRWPRLKTQLGGPCPGKRPVR